MINDGSVRVLKFLLHSVHTVRKMDLILRSIQRRPKMQFSMARMFKLQLLRRYSVKFSKMRNFTLGSPWLGKLKNTGGRRTINPWISSPRLYPCATVTCKKLSMFLKHINIFSFLTDYVKFRSNEYKMAENALSHMRRKLVKDRV